MAALAAGSRLLQSWDTDDTLRFAERAAALAAPQQPRTRAEAASALGWALAYQGRREEAVAQLHTALALLDPDQRWDRATALQGLGLAVADLPVALRFAQEAATLFRQAGDRMQLANTLYTMASRSLDAGVADDEVEAWLREGLALSEAVGDEHERAHALLGLARLAATGGAHGRAEDLLGTCLPLMERLGDRRCTGHVLRLQGERALDRGDLDAAEALLRRSVELAEPVADRLTLAAARAALATLERRRG